MLRGSATHVMPPLGAAVLLMLSLSWSGPAPAELVIAPSPCTDQPSTKKQIECLEVVLHTAEQALQLSVQRLRESMEQLRSDGAVATDDPLLRFEQAQSAWRKSALADCAWLNSTYLGGTLGRPSQLLCLIRMSLSREHTLKEALSLRTGTE